MPTGKASPNYNQAATTAAARATAAAAQAPTGTIVGWGRSPLKANVGAPTATQATATLPPPPAGTAYLVEIVDLQCNSATASTASVQVDGFEMDFSTAANHDVGAEVPAIYVAPGSTFTVVWSGLTVPCTAVAIVQYRIIVP